MGKGAHDMTMFEQFIQEVKTMRELQTRYFRGEKGLLDRSKAQERKVDAMIIEQTEGKQNKLFGA